MQNEIDPPITNLDDQIIWYVLGAGAIGSLFAWHMASGGLEPVLIYRKPVQDPVTIRYQPVDPEADQPQTRPFRVDDGITSIPRLLVTVKAHQTETALLAIRERIKPDSLIVLLQNGMGSWESVKRLFPRNPCLIATTTEGAHRGCGNSVVHAGTGHTWVGALQPEHLEIAQALCHSWHRIGLNLEFDPNILQRLWHKLAINCAINPLTVIYDCSNGKLLENPQARQTMRALCEEVEQVMAAAMPQPSPATQPGQLFQLVCGVAEKTGNNISSMLQDVRAGRDTEIQFITGYLVQEAARFSINVRQNQQLLEHFSSMKSKSC